MNLSVGIVGLPNVGKSTLFNALLKKQAALSANYPFATIEPNVGVTEVPDSRLPVLAEIVDTEIIKPALVEFIDIAGLVKGAAQGEGLGNKFLSHIRTTDAICHVLRAFEDQTVAREGSVNPQEDLAAIRTELQLADLAIVNKQKETRGAVDQAEQERWQAIVNFKVRLEAGQNALPASQFNKKTQHLTSQEKTNFQVARELNLLTCKPELFVLNVNEIDLKQTAALRKKYAHLLSTKQQSIKPEQIVVVSAKIESELAALSAQEQALYMQELGLEQSGLARLAQVAYQTLGLQSFLTAGELEVRAWTIEKGTTALEAAGVIHSDFAQNFVKAKIASFKDFVQHQGWIGCKEAGKLRLEGRDYVMQPDDVVEFMVGR